LCAEKGRKRQKRGAYMKENAENSVDKGATSVFSNRQEQKGSHSGGKDQEEAERKLARVRRPVRKRGRPRQVDGTKKLRGGN